MAATVTDLMVVNNGAPLTKAKADSESSAAHVRSYFPEALYINPEIITDKDGRASIVDPHGRFHYDVAHGDDRFHAVTARSARHVEPESLSGFLCRSRPASHADPRRSRFDSGRHLQLLGFTRRRQPASRSRTTGSRWWTMSPEKSVAGRFRPRGRIAVHPRSQTHRQIQAHAFGST